MSKDAQPWLSMYPSDLRVPQDPEFATILDAYRAVVAKSPSAELAWYFGRTFSFAEIDEASDALAAAFEQHGIERGDRVSTYLQNVPQFVIALIATWKIGAICVPLNPMLRDRELLYQLNDSGAVALISLSSLYDSVARIVLPDTSVRLLITTSGDDYAGDADRGTVSGLESVPVEGTIDFLELLAEFADRRPTATKPSEDEIAMFGYTSGTTGLPKAAVISHRNAMIQGWAFRNLADIGPGDRVLGIAPLFHITGFVCQLVPCLITPASISLTFRFDPAAMLASMLATRPTFAVGAITAFVGLTQHPSFTRDHFSSYRRIHSGGAPISPAAARQFEEATGHKLLGAYGMTEATAQTHIGPFGYDAPIDPVSGAYAVGIPTPGTEIRLVDVDGNDVAPGAEGEILMRHRGVIDGYWNRPEETANTIRDGWLHSGDIGIMDEQGWTYIVDRKKDIIICSGFNVWPREVEDVLYEHPAVREVAVVGVPDEYRGEAVKAFVSLKAGAIVAPSELIAFAGERLSAYKRPREVEILPELPKTVSGKILRRELRAG
jgi:long-chain acyl-CoA synthetase